MPFPLPIAPALKPFLPSHFPYAKFAFTVALGMAAGWAFQRMSVPLPWMLGPMCAVTMAVLVNLPVSAPAVVRPPMTALIGVMLGSNVSPALLAQIPQMALTIALQFVLLTGLSAVGVWYYRRVARLDPVTAFYAGMPGGMIEMSMLGEDRGGDGQAVILVHSARVLMIIAIVPFLVQFIEHVSLGPRQASAVSVMDAPLATFLWLVPVTVVGVMLGRRLRLPARDLFGPMFVSIGVHASGLTDFVLPREIVIGAQLLLGSVIGCRFIGYDKRAILRIFVLSFGATALLLALTAAFCLAVAKVLDVGLARLLLAYAPGGIAEMSLVAMALHLEVAFVMVHQFARILVVASAAAPIHALLGWKAQP